MRTSRVSRGLVRWETSEPNSVGKRKDGTGRGWRASIDAHRNMAFKGCTWQGIQAEGGWHRGAAVQEGDLAQANQKPNPSRQASGTWKLGGRQVDSVWPAALRDEASLQGTSSRPANQRFGFPNHYKHRYCGSESSPEPVPGSGAQLRVRLAQGGHGDRRHWVGGAARSSSGRLQPGAASLEKDGRKVGREPAAKGKEDKGMTCILLNVQPSSRKWFDSFC